MSGQAEVQHPTTYSHGEHAEMARRLGTLRADVGAALGRLQAQFEDRLDQLSLAVRDHEAMHPAAQTAVAVLSERIAARRRLVQTHGDPLRRVAALDSALEDLLDDAWRLL